MHDDVLLISFTKSHIQNANVSQRTGIEKNTSMKCGNYMGARRGGETDQQKIIMHKAYCNRDTGDYDVIKSENSTLRVAPHPTPALSQFFVYHDYPLFPEYSVQAIPI